MALEEHLEALGDELEVLAGMKLGEMWDRYLGEFLAEYGRLERQRLPAAELEKALLSFMEGLSVKPDERVARQATSVAYNQGRNAELLTAAEVVVRSEVLDTNTCRACSLLDSEIFVVGSSEYYANMPPAQCEGGDNCRGFYIPIGGVA